MPRQSSSTLPCSPPYRVFLVVLEQVTVQRPEQYHGHHGCQEQSDQDRVDQREPLHIGLGHGAKDVVPATGPADLLRLTELYCVGVRELKVRCLWDHLALRLGAAGGIAAAGQLDLSSNNAAISGVGACALVVGQDQVHVVEDVGVVL